jgi:hypothetical protein
MCRSELGIKPAVECMRKTRVGAVSRIRIRIRSGSWPTSKPEKSERKIKIRKMMKSRMKMRSKIG